MHVVRKVMSIFSKISHYLAIIGLHLLKNRVADRHEHLFVLLNVQCLYVSFDFVIIYFSVITRTHHFI